MRINITYSTLLAILFFSLSLKLTAQNNGCVQCNGCNVTGTNASAIGNNNTASGNNSFSGGYNTLASGSNSFAFGYGSKATQSTNIALGNTAEASGINSYAFGSYVKANAQNSIAIGTGTTASYPLTNSTPYSIALGVNSNKPTMLITKSLNNNYTGKVAIGQVTSPQTKLHVKADSNEDAGLFLEPTNKNLRTAFLRLFDADHTITVDRTMSMQLKAGGGSIDFQGDHYCFGNVNEAKARIYTNDKASIYYNAKRNKDAELRDTEASSYAIDFSNDALQIRTAYKQSPRGSEITNWNQAVSVNTDGKITLNGKIGINTKNNVDGYALAVDGGVISTKVFIKEVNHWPDHVFADDYKLLDINELKNYLNTNKHLPGIPSEKEVIEHGYDLNEMQFLLLEKIEEMTRYILQLQEEIDALKTQSQDNKNVHFTYDENGNRISRYLTFKRLFDPLRESQIQQELSYHLFPNPTPGQFSVVLKEDRQGEHLHAVLYTMTGTLLEDKVTTETQTLFDLSNQPSGIYLLEIEGSQGKQSWKVIKK